MITCFTMIKNVRTLLCRTYSLISILLLHTPLDRHAVNSLFIAASSNSFTFLLLVAQGKVAASAIHLTVRWRVPSPANRGTTSERMLFFHFSSNMLTSVVKS